MPDALDDAALLEGLDNAIAEGGRLLAELSQLRAGVARAFLPSRKSWRLRTTMTPISSRTRCCGQARPLCGLASQSTRSGFGRCTAGSTAIGAGRWASEYRAPGLGHRTKRRPSLRRTRRAGGGGR